MDPTNQQLLNSLSAYKKAHQADPFWYANAKSKVPGGGRFSDWQQMAGNKFVNEHGGSALAINPKDPSDYNQGEGKYFSGWEPTSLTPGDDDQGWWKYPGTSSWYAPVYSTQESIASRYNKRVEDGLSPNAYQDYIEGIKAGGDKYGGWGYIRTPNAGPDKGIMFGGGGGGYYTTDIETKKRMLDLLGYGDKQTGGEALSQLAENLTGGEMTSTLNPDDLMEASAMLQSMDLKYDPKYSGGEQLYPKELDQESIEELLEKMPDPHIDYRGGVALSPTGPVYDSETREQEEFREEAMRSQPITDFLRNLIGFGNVEGDFASLASAGFDDTAEIDYSQPSGNWQGPLARAPRYTDYMNQLLTGASDIGFGELPINDPESYGELIPQIDYPETPTLS